MVAEHMSREGEVARQSGGGQFDIEERTLILRRGGSDSDPEDSRSSVIGRPSTFSDLEITNFCNDIQYIGILQLLLKRQSQEM